MTNQAFEGCIRNLELSSTARDLNNNKLALNVIPGCQTVSRIVSFSGDVGNSFIAMDPVDVNTDFEMTMKVKGSEGDGVLFHVTDDSNNHVRVHMKVQCCFYSVGYVIFLVLTQCVLASVHLGSTSPVQGSYD